MKTIAVIDDRDSQRKSLVIAINNSLEKLYPEWSIIDIKPFNELALYRTWILENEISVLIIDERLNEEKGTDGKFAGYLGHQLVKYLREYFKNLPVFMITNYPPEEDLEDTMKDFNLIIQREEFINDSDKFTNLFVVSGRSFYHEYSNQLERLSLLAEKIANGTATDRELVEINGLRTNLSLPHFSDDIVDREHYLKEFEDVITKMKELQNEIRKYLDDNKQ